jgi:hypothetical protein
MSLPLARPGRCADVADNFSQTRSELPVKGPPVWQRSFYARRTTIGQIVKRAQAPMSTRSPITSRGPMLRRPFPSMAAVQPRAPTRPPAAQDRRRALIVGGAMAGILMIGTATVTAIQLTRGTQRLPADVIRVRDQQRCRQSFDNQTGYLTETQHPCESPVLFDANDLPPPSGTIRRLDDISKSFTSR